jgi:ribosomal protein S18 acetylase RimI-like enzyme
MIIRKMRKEDIPELATLYKQFWKEESSPELMLPRYKTLACNESYILLSAILDNQLAGSVQGIICDELYGTCRPFMVIENFIVDSTLRRKGIGKALFVEIEKYAIKNNCHQIVLVTENDRYDACRFYESVGFNPGKHKGFKKELI